MNPATSIAPTMEDLIQQNARLQKDNSGLASEQAKLVAKMNAISGELLQAKAVNAISSEVNDVVTTQAIEIHALKEEVKFRNKVVAGCALVSLVCLAYAFAPVWLPAATAKVAWIKLSVIGLL